MACSNGKFIFVWKCLKINSIFCIFIALLAGTLRTYQKAGCDAEYIALSCPRGTSISIEIAQYGNILKGTYIWFYLIFILLICSTEKPHSRNFPPQNSAIMFVHLILFGFDNTCRLEVRSHLHFSWMNAWKSFLSAQSFWWQKK